MRCNAQFVVRGAAGGVARFACALFVCTAPVITARAQAPRRVQAESRLEVIAGRAGAVRFAAGANAIFGTNVRVAVLLAGGSTRINHAWRASGGVDAVARFHFDPLLQFRRGFYAGGGAALLFDDGARRRVRALIVTGFEGSPSRAGWIPGAEIGLGGGARIGVTMRRARVGAR